MPYAKKRTRYIRKARRRRRRGNGRIVPIGRPMSMLVLGIHYFKRTSHLATLTSATTQAEYTPTFQNINAYADFTALFDQYKLLKVVYTFRPNQNASLTANATRIVSIRCAEDPDGGGTLTWEQLGEQRHKDIYLNRVRSVVMYKPSVQQEIYRGPATTAYAPKNKQWLDMALTDIPHYSMKIAIYDPTTLPANWKCELEQTIYFACKGVR